MHGLRLLADPLCVIIRAKLRHFLQSMTGNMGGIMRFALKVKANEALYSQTKEV